MNIIFLSDNLLKMVKDFENAVGTTYIFAQFLFSVQDSLPLYLFLKRTSTSTINPYRGWPRTPEVIVHEWMKFLLCIDISFSLICFGILQLLELWSNDSEVYVLWNASGKFPGFSKRNWMSSKRCSILWRLFIWINQRTSGTSLAIQNNRGWECQK